MSSVSYSLDNYRKSALNLSVVYMLATLTALETLDVKKNSSSRNEAGEEKEIEFGKTAPGLV